MRASDQIGLGSSSQDRDVRIAARLLAYAGLVGIVSLALSAILAALAQSLTAFAGAASSLGDVAAIGATNASIQHSAGPAQGAGDPGGRAGSRSMLALVLGLMVTSGLIAVVAVSHLNRPNAVSPMGTIAAGCVLRVTAVYMRRVLNGVDRRVAIGQVVARPPRQLAVGAVVVASAVLNLLPGQDVVDALGALAVLGIVVLGLVELGLATLGVRSGDQ